MQHCQQHTQVLLIALVLGFAACMVSAAGNGAMEILIHPATPPRTVVQLPVQAYADNSQPPGKSIALPPTADTTAGDAPLQGAARRTSTPLSAASVATTAAPAHAAGDVVNSDSTDVAVKLDTEKNHSGAKPALLSAFAAAHTSTTAAPSAAKAAVAAKDNAQGAAAAATAVLASAASPTAAAAVPTMATPSAKPKDIITAVKAAGMTVPMAASGASNVHNVNPSIAPPITKAATMSTATALPGSALVPPAMAANPILTPAFAAKPPATSVNGTTTMPQPASKATVVVARTQKPNAAGTQHSVNQPTATAATTPFLQSRVGSNSTASSQTTFTANTGGTGAPVTAAATSKVPFKGRTAPNPTAAANAVIDVATAAAAARASLPPTLQLPGPTVKPPAPFIFKQKSATKTIRIGCSMPFEGSQKSVGEAVFQAMKMAITNVAAKEVPGVNVNLTCLNSKCEDIPAYQAVHRFADDKAVAVVGDICSAASVAAAGVGSTRRIVVISPASTSPSLSEVDYFFRTVPSDKHQGVAAASLMRTNGIKTIGIVYEDNAYGYGLAFSIIAAFTKDGGAVPVSYKFTSTKGDPKAAAAQMKQGVKDKKLGGVFVSTSNLTFAADFLVAAKAAGLAVPVYSGDALADYTVFQNIKGRPSVLKNLTTLSVAPGSKDFVAAFANFTKTQPSVSYQAYAAHAYDAIVAVMKAYQAAAAPKDGPAIKQQMQKTNFMGVAGPVLFDKYGDLMPDNKTYVYLNFNTTDGQRIVRGFAFDRSSQ